MTTTETVTTEQIKNLMDNAGNAGDREMVEICKRALHMRGMYVGSNGPLDRLSGDTKAIAECVKVISDTEAMS